MSVLDLRREANDPDTSPKRLEQLSRHTDPGVRLDVAQNVATPVEVLERLSSDNESRVRQAVALNPAAPRHLLERGLADPAAHWNLRNNPSTPGDLLDKIPLPNDFWGIERLLQHPNILPVTLHKLMNNYYWQQVVLKHPRLDEKGLRLILEQSAPHTYEWPYVFQQALQHPLISSEALYSHLLHSSESLSTAVWQTIFSILTPQHQQALLQAGGWAFQEAYARLGQDVATLQQLAQHENRMVRRGVGLNPATPAEVLDTLSRDPNKHVRAGVAANPMASPALLTRLSTDTNGLVRGAVAARPDAPAEALTQLAQDHLAWIRERAQRSVTSPQR